jgi:hypothetical protein
LTESINKTLPELFVIVPGKIRGAQQHLPREIFQPYKMALPLTADSFPLLFQVKEREGFNGEEFIEIYCSSGTKNGPEVCRQ